MELDWSQTFTATSNLIYQVNIGDVYVHIPWIFPLLYCG